MADREFSSVIAGKGFSIAPNLVQNQNMERFSRAVALLLDDRDISQNSLARKSGFASSTLSRWLSGKQTPSLEDALKIAEALEVSLDELVGRSPLPSALTDFEKWALETLRGLPQAEARRRLLGLEKETPAPTGDWKGSGTTELPPLGSGGQPKGQDKDADRSSKPRRVR